MGWLHKNFKVVHPAPDRPNKGNDESFEVIIAELQEVSLDDLAEWKESQVPSKICNHELHRLYDPTNAMSSACSASIRRSTRAQAGSSRDFRDLG